MSDALVVYVNRGDHHTVQPAVEEFEASGPFVLRLDNRGAGCHLHLTFHGELAPGPGLEDDNPYLPEGETMEVPVRVLGDLRPARGSIEVVTGYGQVSTTVEVEVTEDASADATVPAGTAGDVGGAGRSAPSASRAGPLPDPEDPTRSSLLPSGGAILAAAPELTPGMAVLTGLAILALLAAAMALRLLDGIAVTVGALAVIATVIGAGVYLLAK